MRRTAAIWLFVAYLGALSFVTIAKASYGDYAKSLCIGLNHAYGIPQQGYKIHFKACKPANYDRVAGMEMYWAWYKVVHKNRVMLSVAKIDPTGQLVEGPYSLTGYEYDHLYTPDAAKRLAA